MSHFKPLNAAALFLTTGVLRPGPFWLLLIVTYVLSATTSLVVTVLTFQDASMIMQNPSEMVDIGSWLTRGMLPLLIQGVVWLVIMLPWIQLMSSGSVKLSTYPFGHAVQSCALAWTIVWGSYMALTVLPAMAVGLFGGFQMTTTSLDIGLLVFVILAFAAIYLVYIWATFRFAALVPLSFMKERLAFAAVWAGSRGLVLKTFLAVLGVMAVGVVLTLLLGAVSLFVPVLSVQHQIMNAMTTEVGPDVSRLVLPVLVQEILMLPVVLMWVGVTVYVAMVIDGWNSDWAREVTQAEQRADAA